MVGYYPWGDVVHGAYCPWGYVVRGDIAHGGIMSGECCPWGDAGGGCCPGDNVQGDNIRGGGGGGVLVWGDFVLVPLLLPHHCIDCSDK